MSTLFLFCYTVCEVINMTLAQRFYNLKTRVAGHEQKSVFVYTFKQPTNEKYNITGMTKANRRIIGELEFALHLSEVNGNRFDSDIEKALAFLESALDSNGVLTNGDCDKAEAILSPLESAAKEYTAILIAHAHIDMNWQWGYDETVAITLATFRTMLNIMDEYPDFHFSQSQASVYKIVEEHDPEMMEEIKARIREGRWEVTASAWVETDKNMPSAESLMRHISLSRDYLSKVWGVRNFDIDFSPDTFGHSRNVPEINSFGGVKYYYHCRANVRENLLYRFRAPSGEDVVAFREPNWYNGGITEHIGSTLIKISLNSSGIKALPVLYGVGDHGGGPTRRDVERAYEMMEWKIYPTLRFGTLLEFFKEAEKIKDVLPVVDDELNFAFPGCYTTQSRIKRGNRRLESTLYSAESMSAMASVLTDFRYDKKRLDGAWQNVLFNHFHDIITGSCVPETREYAMALYQRAGAEANTQIQNAARKIGLVIDTSSIDVDTDDMSTAEGAGVGYGVKDFVGVPSTERGIGKTRIFHIFNTLPYPRTETAELTLWDWVGDLKRIAVFDKDGNALEYQVKDSEPQPYWDHRFIRVLCNVSVPALGYTTVVVRETEYNSYPAYINLRGDRFTPPHDDIVLENEYIRAVIDISSGRISSLTDKTDGKELLSGTAGFTFIQTECKTSNAWLIGRNIAEHEVDQALEIKKLFDGTLTRSVKVKYDVFGSDIEVTYSLDKGARTVKVDALIDWRHHGNGKDTIPVLDYRVGLAQKTADFVYGIPAGNIKRGTIANDVPALKYGMAGRLLLMSDCKYGYRGRQDSLALTLINSSTRPDRYPEIGRQTVNIYVGACDISEVERISQITDTALIIQPSNSHGGTLPLEKSLISVGGEGITVSAVIPEKDGITVRFYETDGKASDVTLSTCMQIKNAYLTDLYGNRTGDADVCGDRVLVKSKPYGITAVKIEV